MEALVKSMPLNRQLKAGIVGCGHITRTAHIPALKRIPSVELVAICDSNGELATDVARRFQINGSYNSFSEMLENEKLNVVHICTPPKTHAGLAIQAMGAGCSILVEKPMCLTVEEADEMLATSKKSEKKLCVVHDQLFIPTIRRVKAVINSGTIGEITGLDIRDSRPPDHYARRDKDNWIFRLPGGVFGEVLPHPLYLVQALLGRVKVIAVHTKKLGSNPMIAVDEIRIVCEGKKGLGTIMESFNSPRSGMMIDIYGTKMNLHVDLWGSVVASYGMAGQGRASKGIGNIRQGVQYFRDTLVSGFKSVIGLHNTGHYTLIRKFVESLQHRTKPPVTAQEAREVVRAYQQITSEIDRVSKKV